MTYDEYVLKIFAKIPTGAQRISILAGGALRAFYDGTKVKDYDLFFRDRGDFLRAVLAFQQSTSPVWAVAQTGPKTYIAEHPLLGKFNLVGFRFGTPREIIDSFDFTCCQFAAFRGHITNEIHTIQGHRSHLDARQKILKLTNTQPLRVTEEREAHYMNDYGYTSTITEQQREECRNTPPSASCPASSG